jgi:xanthine dehydrogenase molybdopterin-binding subunit B
VEYEVLTPILSIAEAIAANSFFGVDRITNGDCDEAFALAEHVLTGTLNTPGQSHFYMEVHSYFLCRSW